MNIQDQNFQNSVIEMAKSSYLELLNELIEEINFDHPFLDKYFSETLSRILKDDKDLKTHSPKKYYWLGQIEALIFLLEVCDEYQGTSALNELEEIEDELFEYWDSSEHSQLFKNYLDEGKSIWESTQEIIPLIENQILSIYHLQVNQTDDMDDSRSLLYTIIPEIGDSIDQLYLYDDFRLLKYNGRKTKTFPTLIFKDIEKEESSYSINGKHYSSENEKAPMSNELNINILPNCSEGKKKQQGFIKSLDCAILILEKFSKNSFNIVKNFTISIIPVNDKEITSYSIQSLPGYSSINMFDRDFTDFIEDLVHQSSHHFLNIIEAGEDLVNEDSENTYYSPWEKSYRPSRELIQNIFTYYYSLNLLSDLFKNFEKLSSENISQEKIAFRICKEYLYLSSCKKVASLIIKDNQLTEFSQILIKAILKDVETYDLYFDNSKKLLVKNKSNLLSELNKIEKLLDN